MTEDPALAWFVGLYEGEGSVRTKHGHGLALEIQMCDEDVLRLVLERFGGTLRPGPPRLPPRRPIFRWRLYGQPARRLILEMLPMLGERRTEQLRRALDACAGQVGRPRAARLAGQAMLPPG